MYNSEELFFVGIAVILRKPFFAKNMFGIV